MCINSTLCILNITLHIVYGLIFFETTYFSFWKVYPSVFLVCCAKNDSVFKRVSETWLYAIIFYEINQTLACSNVLFLPLGKFFLIVMKYFLFLLNQMYSVFSVNRQPCNAP